MIHGNFIAVHFFPAKFPVERVEVQSMPARDEGERLVQVGAQFFGGSRFAGIISGGHETAAQSAGRAFKTADVIALPAVERNRDRRKFLNDLFRVHAGGFIPTAGQLVSAFHRHRRINCHGGQQT